MAHGRDCCTVYFDDGNDVILACISTFGMFASHRSFWSAQANNARRNAKSKLSMTRTLALIPPTKNSNGRLSTSHRMAKAAKKARAINPAVSGGASTKVVPRVQLPISKLPVEVLCKIFHFVRTAPPSIKENKFYTPSDFRLLSIDWVAVSRVCQHWRAVSLNDPTLWTDLPIYYPKWSTEMLQRSKGAGLIVSLGKTVQDDLLSAILGHTLRIAELTVSDAKRLQMLIKKGLLSSTPKLERLCLKNEYYGLDEEPPNPLILSTMFPDAVGLRHLELIGVDPEWNSPLFSRPITTLELGQISPSKKPTVKEFRSIMEHMSTTLQVLTLRNAFPVESATPLPTQNIAPVSLTSLRRLALGAKPADIISFFDNVTLTDKAEYADLFVFLDNGPGQDFTQFLDTIGRQEALGGLVSDAISVLIYGEIHGTKKGKKWQNFELALCSSEILTSAPPENHAPPSDEDDLESRLPGLELVVRSRLPQSPTIAALPFRCIFTDMFNTFQWLNLRELGLAGLYIKAFPDFSQTLATTFGALPSVNLVTVGPECTNPLFDALNYNSGMKQNGRSKAAISFAGVKTISLISVNIQSRVDEMAGSLLKRHKRGARIKTLSFEQCRGKTNKSLKLLKEYVSNVSWDSVKL